MSQTITFRPTKKLAGWIEQAAQQMGVSRGQFIRTHLEQAQAKSAKRFLRLAGTVKGPSDLSTRKGFSKK